MESALSNPRPVRVSFTRRSLARVNVTIVNQNGLKCDQCGQIWYPTKLPLRGTWWECPTRGCNKPE